MGKKYNAADWDYSQIDEVVENYKPAGKAKRRAYLEALSERVLVRLGTAVEVDDEKLVDLRQKQYIRMAGAMRIEDDTESGKHANAIAALKEASNGQTVYGFDGNDNDAEGTDDDPSACEGS